MAREHTRHRLGVKAGLGALAAFVFGWIVRLWRGRREDPAREDMGDPGLTDPEAKPEVEEWGHESFPASDPPSSW